VRDVLNKMDDECQGGESDVSIGGLPRAHISRSHLTVLVDNLLRNAVRYGTKEGTSIEVYGERSDEGVRLYVRDHGVGIPEEERDRIFDVLYRGARTKHLPGSGVGLALVRKIARLYGGTVRVDETPGGGATFCLELRDVEADEQD
jgi:signal transduction histidine kinase